MTLVYSALAGGDCIEDADRMRVAATAEVLATACGRRPRSGHS